MLLGKEPHDIDIATDARPEQVQALFRRTYDVGAHFGVIVVNEESFSFEVATFRADGIYLDGRRPETVEFSTPQSDAARRDFTINGMFFDPVREEIVDYVGGEKDLAARVLRAIGDPAQRFREDRLRMLRAVRFGAHLGFEIEEETWRAVRENAGEIHQVSAERIRDELSKLLVVDDPAPGLWFCTNTGLFQQFLPEIPGMRLEQDPIHRHKDVLSHTIAVVGNVAPRTPAGEPNGRTRLAALLHDIAKPKTRGYGPKGVTFHHHEVVGARMARDRMQALRYPAAEVDAVSRLVELHLRFHGYGEGDGGWTDAAVRRFVRDAGPLLDELIELTRCDCTTRNERKARLLARRMDGLVARIAALREQEELGRIRPDLDGAAVMARLGTGPGPLVGRALAFLLELRLEEGPLGEDAAGAALDEWWAAQPEAGATN